MVTLLTSGAGGYGDPFLRDPASVLRDVERGVVSVEAAERDYGVVLNGGVVDDVATAAARRLVGSPAGLEFGPERRAWESVFRTDLVDHLVEALFELPPAQRSARRAEIYAEVLRGLPAGFPRVEATEAQLASARTAFVRLAARVPAE